MPRDKNRTGRRQPRKNGPRASNDDIIISTEPIVQQQYESFEAPTQEYGYRGHGEFGGRPGDVDPAAFGLVDPDVQHYFKNLEKAISGKEFDGRYLYSYCFGGKTLYKLYFM